MAQDEEIEIKGSELKELLHYATIHDVGGCKLQPRLALR